MSTKRTAICLKVKKARVLLAEVDVHIQFKFYETAINRLYYGCYHIVRALLLTKDLVPKTHSGVVSNLNQHFVSIGVFDKENAAFFSRLLNERMDEDYGDFLVADSEAIDVFVKPAKEFFNYVESLLNQLGYSGC